jgi:homoserine dehydrogenase
LVIVPGFVGVDDGGARTLLGRGGSDFSAIFLAGELGADKVCLYKDVDGVFESDPSTFKTARRYTRISWVDALQVARPLLQPQAVEYAQERGLTIAVEALGSSESTVVGPRTSAPAYHEQAPPLRIALAGYGIVGQALAERLLAEDHLRIEVILVRETARPRQYPAPAPLTTSLDGFLAVEADVVIDALSCDLTGSLLCRRALKRGLDVVSASKRTVSRDHARLREAASGSRRQILYSAAVGGSTAILETIDLATRAGKIVEVTGVLNGTVNFILQRLSQGCDFSEALSEAKTRGFAEEDSYADLSGEDAAAKLRLIAHRASGVEPCSLSVPCEHLDEDRAETIRRSGERWVQVGQVRWLADGSIISDVTLKPARFVTSLTALDNEWNSAEVKLADGRTFQCIGRGAGGAPTSEAIVADLYDLLKRRAAARTFASAGVTCLD